MANFQSSSQRRKDPRGERDIWWPSTALSHGSSEFQRRLKEFITIWLNSGNWQNVSAELKCVPIFLLWRRCKTKTKQMKVSIWLTIFGSSGGSSMRNDDGLLFQDKAIELFIHLRKFSARSIIAEDVTHLSWHNAASPYCVLYTFICHQSTRLYYVLLFAWEPLWGVMAWCDGSRSQCGASQSVQETNFIQLLCMIFFFNRSLSHLQQVYW